MSANVQFGEVSGRPGTSAPTIDGVPGGTMCDGPDDGMGDGPGGVMVGRDVLGVPRPQRPPRKGRAPSRPPPSVAQERDPPINRLSLSSSSTIIPVLHKT